MGFQSAFIYIPLASPSQGFRVFAGCLNVNGEGASTLKRHGSSRLVVLQMDVTKEEQLAKAADEVKKQLPSGGKVLHSCVQFLSCDKKKVQWRLDIRKPFVSKKSS